MQIKINSIVYTFFKLWFNILFKSDPIYVTPVTPQRLHVGLHWYAARIHTDANVRLVMYRLEINAVTIFTPIVTYFS